MTTYDEPPGLPMFAGKEPPRALPVTAPQACAELARLMRELGEHPEDSPAIVRDALDTAGSIAGAAGLAWTRPAGDCVVLDDARAVLVAIWDLLVRADARSLGANPDSLQASRGDGYGPVVAAVGDARTRLTAHAGGTREPVPAQRLSDPWRTDHEPGWGGADTDALDAPLSRAVQQAVAAANSGHADDEAFPGLRAALTEAFPDTPPPSAAPAGKPPPHAGCADPDRWAAARALLAHARAVAPATPGLARLERAIGRAARAAHRPGGAGPNATRGARAAAASTVSPADCRIVLAVGGARAFAPGFRPRAPDTAAGPLRLPGEGHLMTIGPTGSGKTTQTIIPAVLRYPGPLIVVDPKGEIEAVTRPRRERLGHPVWSIRPDTARSERINPLETVDRSNLIAECGRLAHLLSAVGLVPGHRDPFWDQTALAVLSGYLAHAVADRGGDPSALAAVADLTARPAPKSLPLKQRIGRWSTSALARAAMDPIIGDTNDTVESRMTESHRGVYAHHVRWLNDPCVTRILGPTTIDLERVRAGLPYTLYVAAPTAHAEVQRPLLRTVIGSLLGLLAQQAARPALNTLLLVDEAHLLGEFEPLRTAVTTLRSYGVQAWTCWQHVAQIQHVWPDWPTLVGNAGILFQCGVPHPHDLPGHPACPPPPRGAVHPISVSVQGQQPANLQALPYYADPEFAGRARPVPAHSPAPDRAVPAEGPGRRSGARPHP